MCNSPPAEGKALEGRVEGYMRSTRIRAKGPKDRMNADWSAYRDIAPWHKSSQYKWKAKARTNGRRLQRMMGNIGGKQGGFSSLVWWLERRKGRLAT